MAELATPYPSQVFLTLFGLPLEDRERLIGWKDAIIAFSLTTDPDSVDLTPAAELYTYLTEAVQAQRRQPRDGILADLLRGDEQLTDNEAVGLSLVFVLAGLDTVTSTIGATMLELARRPTLRKSLRENPDEVPAFIEEMIRLEPSAPIVGRVTTQPVTVAGVTLPAGVGRPTLPRSDQPRRKRRAIRRRLRARRQAAQALGIRRRAAPMPRCPSGPDGTQARGHRMAFPDTGIRARARVHTGDHLAVCHVHAAGVATAALCRRFCQGDHMTVDTAKPSVFDAGLPTLDYSLTDTPQQIYPQFRAAQRLAPIALGPIGPEILSYELARTALRDPRFVVPQGIHLSAHGITSGPLWDRVTRSILNMEGEEHRRLRSLVSRAFTPRATARMHDTIHTVINELIDQVADAGRCEFVADIARPYPIPVICALLGAPREDWQQFSRWADDIFKIVSFDCNLAEEEPVVLKAWGEFDDYIDGMIAERRNRLTDDLLSELIRAEDGGDRLDAGDLRMLAFSILVAGTDTTRSQLAASMQVLCDHPGQWALLRDRPELAMRAVEETMRHSPSMCSTVRSAIADTTVGEYTFPAGTFIQSLKQLKQISL